MYYLLIESLVSISIALVARVATRKVWLLIRESNLSFSKESSTGRKLSQLHFDGNEADIKYLSHVVVIKLLLPVFAGWMLALFALR